VISAALDDLIARAEKDPTVLGVVLSGSQARDGMATGDSDVDVYVIVPGYGGAWSATKRSPEIDEIPYSLAELEDRSDRWQRYSFRGAKVLLDRMDGGIAERVRAQAMLTPAEAEEFAREQLDGYINFVYRAAKNSRDGRPDLARLEEIEAAPWFLETLFALHGRVRPYNKYLRWELDTHPLPAPWTADFLISTLIERPSVLFTDLEPLARDRGLADVVDGWDDLDLIRAYAAAPVSEGFGRPAR
jgi:predicted nucleotidyltransferase